MRQLDLFAEAMKDRLLGKRRPWTLTQAQAAGDIRVGDCLRVSGGGMEGTYIVAAINGTSAILEPV